MGIPPGSALEAKASGRALRRAGGVALLGFLAGLALVVAAGGVWLAQRRADDDAASGELAAGTVQSVSAQTVGRSRQEIGTVTVQFDVAGQPTTAEVDVGTAVSHFAAGDAVTVVYDSGDPTRASLQGTAPPDSGVPWPILAGIGLALAGVSTMARARVARTRRILRDNPWVTIDAELRQVAFVVGFRTRGRTVVVLHPPDEPAPVIAEPLGLRRFAPTVAPVAWVAGWGRRFVVAPPGGAPVTPVKLVVPAAEGR